MAVSLSARPAHAQRPLPAGFLAMRWDACYGDGGADARTFACDTNTGTEVLLVSAFPPAAIPQLDGAAATMTVLSTGAGTPTWWQLDTSISGECRAHIPAYYSADFTPPAGSSQCQDFWFGGAAGGASFSESSVLSNQPQFRLVCSLASTVSVPAGVELFVARLVITHAKTVGAGSCGGCLTGVCIGLNNVQLTQPVGVGDFLMLDAVSGTSSDVVAWQMSGAVMPHTTELTSHGYDKHFSGCLSATDAARPTWGAIKRMYH